MTQKDQQLEELLQKIWWLREKNISEESALDRTQFPERWLAEAEARSMIMARIVPFTSIVSKMPDRP
jgi:hypothetical protein